MDWLMAMVALPAPVAILVVVFRQVIMAISNVSHAAMNSADMAMEDFVLEWFPAVQNAVDVVTKFDNWNHSISIDQWKASLFCEGCFLCVEYKNGLPTKGRLTNLRIFSKLLPDAFSCPL